MNHIKYYELVNVQGLQEAYVEYQKDGGILPIILFENRYSLRVDGKKEY